MPTPLPEALRAVAETLEGAEPPTRPTLRYRLLEHTTTPEPHEEGGSALEDRSFAFLPPTPIEPEGTAGITARLRTWAVGVALALDTADLGTLARASTEAEHLAAWDRAIDARATWPLGVHEVVWSVPDEPRPTDDGGSLLVARLLITVWET